MELVFVTGNENKALEAREILGLDLVWEKMDLKEIQSDSLEDIAKSKVDDAYSKLKRPCFVEDAGLFIKALNGFPGPYSSFVNRKLGCNGIIKLMEGITDRSAYFKAVIAFHDGKDIHVFSGKCNGKIALLARGKSGFGFDPIFIPEGYEKTFAEEPEIKRRTSHRYNALMKFKEHLKF